MPERNATATTSATSNLESDRTSEMGESTTSENSSLSEPLGDPDMASLAKELDCTLLAAAPVTGSTAPAAAPVNTITMTLPSKEGIDAEPEDQVDGTPGRLKDPLDSLQPSEAQCRFSLTVEEMGEKLIPNLVRIMADDEFFGKISIGDLGVDWMELISRIEPPGDHEHFAVEHTSTRYRGVLRLLLSQSEELKLPDLSQLVDSPLQTNIRNYLQQIIDKPPKELRTYYVGPLPQLPLDSLLPSGEELNQLGELSGITSLWAHIGESGSGTLFHCEDTEFGSYNLTLYGWKIFILIKLYHTEKFKAFFKRLWKCGNCNQAICHTSLLISPARLAEEGIEFNIVVAGPGDMITTHPRQYYMVLNLTRSCIVATNFLPSGKEVIPTGLVVCPKDRLYGLKHENIIRFEAKGVEKRFELSKRVRDKVDNV
jgi:hypothetical protein